MKEIIIYALLALANLPLALDKKNPYRNISWLAIGFQLGVLATIIIDNLK